MTVTQDYTLQLSFLYKPHSKWETQGCTTQKLGASNAGTSFQTRSEVGVQGRSI